MKEGGKVEGKEEERKEEGEGRREEGRKGAFICFLVIWLLCRLYFQSELDHQAL